MANVNLLEAGTFQGRIWQCDTPETILTATLITGSDGPRITLIDVGALYLRDDLSSPRDFYGDFVKLGLTTFCGCYVIGGTESRRSNRNSLGLATMRISLALIGIHFDLLAESEPTFDNVVFSVSGLREWIGKSPFKHDWIDDCEVLRITSVGSDVIQFDEFELEINQTVSTSVDRFEPKYCADIEIALKASELKNYADWLTCLVNPFCEFVTFATQKTCHLREIKVEYSHMIGSRNVPYSYSLLFRPWYSIQEESAGKAFFHPRFDFDLSEGKFQDQFQNWLDCRKSLRDPIRLLMTTIYTPHRIPHQETEFLFAVQACESLHSALKLLGTSLPRPESRRLRNLIMTAIAEETDGVQSAVSNLIGGLGRPTLVERLIFLFNKHENLLSSKFDDLQALAIGCKNTRNYLSHYGPEMASKTMEIIDLIDATDALWLILGSELLEQIGFSIEESHEIQSRTSEFISIGTRTIL